MTIQLLLALLFSSSLLSGQVNSISAGTPDAVPINHFSVRGVSGRDALIRLGRQTKLPFGIVEDQNLCRTQVVVEVRDKTVGAVLTSILDQLPGYLWSVNEGVIEIRPREVRPSARQILDIVVPHFAVGETTMALLTAYLQNQISAVLRPGQGSAGSIPVSPQATHVAPFKLDNATVEQILNHIVKLKGHGLWILYSLPANGTERAVQSRVDISSYADDSLPSEDGVCTNGGPDH